MNPLGKQKQHVSLIHLITGHTEGTFLDLVTFFYFLKVIQNIKDNF